MECQIMFCKDKEEIKVGKKGADGTFAVFNAANVNDGVTKVTGWTSRNNFAKANNNWVKFYFSHGLPKPSRGLAVASFINRVEALLKIPGDDRSQFGATSRRRYMWVKPSPFWAENAIKKSLFVALLSCSRNYRIVKDNFKESLYSEEYLAETKDAVERFLSGHTCYTGNGTDWHQCFVERWTWNGFCCPDLDVLLKAPVVKSEENLHDFNIRRARQGRECIRSRNANSTDKMPKAEIIED